jgi:hypothetical protein
LKYDTGVDFEENEMEVRVKRLGLAAYIKMNGAEFKGHEADPKTGKGEFVFESDKTARKWEIEYSNSCCNQHDSEVMSLRKLMR